MEKLNQIDAVIDHMFETANDRMMMKAFCYRRYVNMLPREVGKELRMSRIKVNLLIQTIPHKRLQSGSFALAYITAIEAIEKYVISNKFNEYSDLLTDSIYRVKKAKRKFINN